MTFCLKFVSIITVSAHNVTISLYYCLRPQCHDIIATGVGLEIFSSWSFSYKSNFWKNGPRVKCCLSSLYCSPTLCLSARARSIVCSLEPSREMSHVTSFRLLWTIFLLPVKIKIKHSLIMNNCVYPLLCILIFNVRRLAPFCERLVQLSTF